MAVWPAALPQAPLAGSLQVATDDAVLRHKTEAGFTIRRARPFLTVNTHTFQMVMTDAQLRVLNEFYITTLGRGVKPFFFQDWEAGDFREFAFVAPPERASVASAVGLWMVSISLERKGE